MKKLFFAVALAFVSMAGMAQNLKANMDESVKPGDDFWQYAVGTWLKNNPLDKVHPENGAFTDRSELNKDRINALVMKYAEKKDLPQGTVSGLDIAIKVLKDIEDIGYATLTSHDVVRHPLVQKIVNAYEKYEEKNVKRGKKKAPVAKIKKSE